MNTATSVLRGVLLGAAGGLIAHALAGWLGLQAPPQARGAAQAAHALQPVRRVDALAQPTWAAAAAARRFIAEAAAASLYDAQAALLVQARGGDAAVQELAALLLRDHETSWPMLRSLANERRVALPAPSLRQRETLLLLYDVAEPTRARVFVRHVAVESALTEIARCEAALQRLADADASLRGWIEQTLPMLRERAALAQRLLPRLAERRPMA